MKTLRTPFLAFLGALLASGAFGEVDLSTPAMQAVRKDFHEQKASLDQTLRDELRALVERNLEDANQRLEEQRRVGNVTGIAVARKGASIFETCLAQLTDTGHFEIPGKLRRELTEMMARFQQEKDAIQSRHDQSVAELEAAGLARFTALVAAGGEHPDADEMQPLFRNLLDHNPAPDEVVAPPRAADGAGDAADENTPLREAPPEIIASSGEADQWITFARWQATVSGLEVLSVPVAERTETEETSRYSPLTETEIRTRYEAIESVRPESQTVFRVKSIAGQNPADVLQWPSAGNKWTLQLRVRPESVIPSQHAIELQVGGAGAPTPVAENTSPETSDRTPEENSLPDDVATAPTAPTPTGTPRVSKIVVVPAITGWRSSGIAVKKYDRLELAVSGVWSCGARREEIDAVGYPPDARFRHYYRGPDAARRQLETAYYGALLMRFGKDGPIGAIGPKASIVAPRDGILYFDINETRDGQARFDNAGTLSVHVSCYDPVR